MVLENISSVPLTVDTITTSLEVMNEEDSFVSREETSVSEDPSSAWMLQSFVTPAQSPLLDSPVDSNVFHDAKSSQSLQSSHGGPQPPSSMVQEATNTRQDESNDTTFEATRQVSLISKSDSFNENEQEEEEPTSPAFSVVTNTGAQPVSPDASSTETPSDSFKSLSTFDSQVKTLHDSQVKTLDFNEQASSTTAPSTDVENSVNDEDSVVEQVEVIQWLPNVSSVQHSFRALTPKTAWGSSRVTPVDRIPYIHGSYASAAPLFVYNTKWMRILRRLMPAGHADAMEILREAEEAHARKSNNDKQMARLMKWAENNPVVAAYGVLNSNTGTESLSRSSSTDSFSSSYSSRRGSRERPDRKRSSRQHGQPVAPVLEWDVFLDPTLVKKVEKAMDMAEQVRNDPVADYQDEIAANIEVDRQVGRLINRMMLAHGSASHLVSEALGVASQYNFTKLVEQGEAQRMYRRREYEKKWKRTGLHFGRNGMDLGGKTWLVREQAQAALMNFERHRNPRIEGKASAKPAGIFVERWLGLFLRALHIAKASPSSLAFDDFYIEQDELTPQVAAAESIKTQPPMCGMFLCLGIEDPNAAKVDHSKTSMAATAGLIEDALGSPLRVILDLKSRRVPARVWARVIDNMRNRGIIVDGLGSFDIEELRSIVQYCASDVKEVRFFHSAGDLQKACHAKEVNIGDTVYFNAGSLLWDRPSKISNVVCGKPDLAQAVIEEDVAEDGVRFQPFAFPNRNNRKDSDPRLPECESTLQDYKDRFQLNIGCYVQEFSISDQNLDAITRFLNKHKSLYNLGLAWGGINGQCHEGLSGDGYWNQRYMGRRWDNTAKPTDDMHLLAPEDHPLVQRAVRAGAWGGIGTVNNIGEEHTPETQALQIGSYAITNTGNTTCG